MGKKKKCTIDVCIQKNPKTIRKWFLEMLLFDPQKMRMKNYTRGKQRKFNRGAFFIELDKELQKEKYPIDYMDGINTIHCSDNLDSDKTALLTATLEYDLYKKNEQIITALIDEIMGSDGIVCKIGLLDDWFWQNHTDVSDYEEKYGSLDGLPLIPHRIFKNEMAVDVEKFPGFDEYIDGIWFGAAWKMWFNGPYYEFVSEEAIENFKECYKNEKIADSCRCITLYEDMDDYENLENRERQWKFKEAIDFQNVIERLRETEINRVNDPELEIEIGNFKHGGIRLFKGYFDEEDNSVPKSKASKMKITEHAKDGSVVWETEENILSKS